MAEPLLRRAAETLARVQGENDPFTLSSQNALAAALDDMGRDDEAAALYSRVLEGRTRLLGPYHRDTLVSISNLARFYHLRDHFAEAEELFGRAHEIANRVLGEDHSSALGIANNLGALYLDQGRFGDAESLLKRVLQNSERVLGPDHPQTLDSVHNVAMTYFAQRDWDRALQFWRRSSAGYAKRVLRSARGSGQPGGGKSKTEARRLDLQFPALIKAAYRLVPAGRPADASLLRETFQAAQWAQSSEAAASLAQMAARGAKADRKLATLVRERQDLAAEWEKRDALRSALLSKAIGERNLDAEAENTARHAAIDASIASIDKELAAAFPDYAALASPAPLAVEEVQALLGANEALVVFLDTPEVKFAPEETFIWVATKREQRWVRSDLGTAALTRKVQALRCGLDDAAWEDGGGQKCRDLLKAQPGRIANGDVAPAILPFDHALAHSLYLALFGQVQDLIKGKQLLIVPSGPLTQLPLQTLVTAPPVSGDHKSAAWLIRDHALTILPAVSSLKALRQVARPSAAKKPMIGFGNPLLNGNQSDLRLGEVYKQLALRAREKQACPKTVWQRVAARLGLMRGVSPVQAHSGLADVEFIRMQAPLPETADELCAVARDVGADVSEIRLGATATEGEVKRLSESGQLAQFRIVHFATHGALAGQIQGNAEPGLLLTPPAVPDNVDDGYLTASEIAGLKLDADWVILSACNTAAGGAQGAEALSGMARAFIYAQARALLVSHWEVDSNATVKLITGAVKRIAADKAMGRSEAMRQSMLAQIDKGEPGEAHPAFWAPFVVVGEGGAAR